MNTRQDDADMRETPKSCSDEMVAFIRGLLDEASPRALVIIGAARLEEEVKSITAIVAAGFEKGRANERRLDLLVALNLMPKDVSFCFSKIAEIRNHFAHTSAPVSLTDSSVQAAVSDLYKKLESRVRLKELTNAFFSQAPARSSQQRASETWVNGDWRRYQTAVFILLRYLMVLKHNLPQKPSPLQIAERYGAE